MIETQLAQLAVVAPVSENRKIPGQPESPIETANIVSTGWGNLPSKFPKLTMQAGTIPQEMTLGMA